VTAPKHLWSGDWRRDSDAAARELAARRTPLEPASTPEETRQKRTRRPGRTPLIVLAVLLGAVASYAVVWAAVGSGGSTSTAGARSSAPAKTNAAWLGVDTTDFTTVGGSGALVTNVVPGGPADAAGLEPGDLITQIGNTPIASPSVIPFALASLHAGDPVQIQFQRGSFTDSAEVTLGARPGGHP
jgi:membrane-associated protease RseP (regulator of RpoE activity)